MLSTNDLIHKKLSAVYGYEYSIDDLWRQYWEDENGGVPIKGGRDLIDFLKKKGAAGNSVTSALRTYFAELNVVGTPSATKPMLLPLREWGVDQILWLPGAPGNYASIPDVNLLNADTAHLHQSVGLWSNDSGASTIQRIEVDPFFGGGHLRWTSTSGGTSQVGTPGPGTTVGAIPISPGQTYSCSAMVRSVSSARQMLLRAHWMQSDGTHISVVTFDEILSVGNVWTELAGSLVAPANAGFLRILVRAAATVTGDEFYLDAVCARIGADPAFVPSTRIVGDVDIRAKVALPETLSSRGSVVSTHTGDGTNGVELQINTDRSMVAVHGNGTAQAARFLGAGTIVPEGPIHVRATLDVDNGASQHSWKAFHSTDGVTWTTVFSGTFAGTTQIGASIAELSVGSRSANTGFPLKSVIQSFEIRDGIDGPVVASADFTNPEEVTGDNWTTPEGHAGTINRSGRSTSELVQEPVFATTESEFLDIPDKPELNVPIGGQFSITCRVQSRGAPDINAPIVAKRTSSGGINKGWALSRISGSNRADFRVADGAVSAGVAEPSISFNDGEHRTVIASIDLENNSVGIQVDNSENFSSAASLTDDVQSSDVVRWSAYPSGTAFPRALLLSWAAIFDRILTSTERAQLAAWNGSVEDEPNWLRTDTDLVLYLNADDQKTYEAYQNDEVVDLRYV